MSDFHYVRTIGPDGGVDAAEGSAIGLDLASVLDAGLPPVRVAVQILSGIAEILAIAEEDQVVHGDLDLDHVFLDDTGAVSLEGFGCLSTIAPEGKPVGTATDRFGLGAVGYALFSPRDLPELPSEEEAYENAAIDAILGLNLEGIPEELIGDIQWFLTRLLSYDPAERPTALEAWRAFGTMTELIDGPDFSTWCNDALDGGGERRDSQEASRPMARPLKGELDETSVTGGPMPKGAVNFEDGGDKGRSTAFWTRQGMKDALAKAMSSDYIDMDPNSEWMPGTPIPPMDRNTSPGGQRWSGPAPVPRRAPGEGRQRAERRTPAPSPIPAPPRGRPTTPQPAPQVARAEGGAGEMARKPPVPAAAPPVRQERETGGTPAGAAPRQQVGHEPSWAGFAEAASLDDDKTELGSFQVPTNKPPTPKPAPMREIGERPGAPRGGIFNPDADPTLLAPGSMGRSGGDAGQLQPARPGSAAARPRRGPSAPTPEPMMAADPNTAPELQIRPIAPNSPVMDAYVPDATDEVDTAGLRSEFPDGQVIRHAKPAPQEGPGEISPAADRMPLAVEDPGPSIPVHEGPIPEVDLSRQPDPFAEVEEQGPSMLVLGSIGAVVMLAVVFCIGVGGIGGAAAIFGSTTTASSSGSSKPGPRTATRPTSRPSPSGTVAKATDAPRPTPRPTRDAPRPGPVPGPSPSPSPVSAPSPGSRSLPVDAPSPSPSPGSVRNPRIGPSPSPSPRPSPSPTSRPSPSPSPSSTAFSAPGPDDRPDPLASLLDEPSGFPPPGSFTRPDGPSSRMNGGVSPPAPTSISLPPLPMSSDAGDSILPFLVPEPAPNPDGSGPSMMQSHMRRHLQAATAARDAVVGGDPEKARQAAQSLEFINPPDALPGNWLPYLVDLRMEAWLMGNSPDIAAAAFKVAQIGQSCASCHEGLRAGPTVTPGAVPSRMFDEKDVMKRHAWAVDWMWVGLLANDQAAWTKGATVLVESPFPSVIFEDFPDQRFMDLENKLHELAAEGQTATRPDQRGLIYGKMLSTCSRCHAVYRENNPPR